jgi:hypothetical protein
MVDFKKASKQSKFRKDIARVINRLSLENESNTPDFILAEYLTSCLRAFDNATNRREEWYGREPKEKD